MQSMTGFGRGSFQLEGREATIEIKAVNSRYLDPNFRMSRNVSFVEPKLRTALAEALHRGKVDLYISYKNTREDRAEVLADVALAQSYQKAIVTLAQALEKQPETTLWQIAALPQVLQLSESEEDEQAVCYVVEQAFSQAIGQLKTMRKKEGEKLCEDLLTKAKAVDVLVCRIDALAPQVEQASKEKLLEKMQEYTQADETLKQRVVMEAALIAEKHALDEELVRLHSHIGQFCQSVRSEGPVGRKLDFIVQEMNREINTIGSKANNAEITSLVIAAKSELEKMREQVQNVE